MALLFLLSGAAAPSAHACGFDGVLDGSFSAAHPRSLGVAFAIRDAVERDVMPNVALEAIAPGAPGYWRAVGRLDTLAARLSAAASDELNAAPAISVLFIDSNLWSRIAPGPNGLRLEPHIMGPQSGDIVIVTSEAVLAEVLAEHISIDTAFARAVIAIDGEDAGVQRVRDLMLKGLDRSTPSNLRDTPRPTGGFFGAKR